MFHHVLKANAVYELPMAQARSFGQERVAGKILGGWQISGIAQSDRKAISFFCRPVHVELQVVRAHSAGRSIARVARTTKHRTPRWTISQLQSMTGLFLSPTTGLPVLLDPKLIDQMDGPAAPISRIHWRRQFGNLGLTPVDGPGYWNVDTALIKRQVQRESQS